MQIPDKVFKLAKEMIEDLENIYKYDDAKHYKQAVAIIKQLKVTPAMDYVEDEEIIPEIIILNTHSGLEIRLNDEYYPEIIIKECDLSDEFCKTKIQEARNSPDDS